MSIKRTLLGSLAAAGIAAGIAAAPLPASASTDGLPDGSWRQSCDRAYVQNGTLHARCRRDGGQYQSAAAQIGSCRAFGNRNGTLFCESSDGASGNMGQWSGSFSGSCREISVDKHGKLKATCRKNNGTYQRTNLQAQKCPSYRAGNRDGNLFCESDDGGNSASRWDGSFRSSCRDASVDSSGTLTATCQAANGSWRRTSLSSRQCGSYRAGNRDGNLFCESGDGGGQNATHQWGGSFSQTCRDISVDSDGTLTANCQTMGGTWNRSSLSLRQCGNHQAGNRDGTLFCER